MKTDSIQQLLERYREGTLSDSGLGELNRLTHRDEVMAAAERRAGGIVRRRRAVAFTVAGLLVAAGAVWTLLPLGGGATPMVAEAITPEAIVPPAPVVETVAPTVAPEAKKEASVAHQAAVASVTRAKTPRQEALAPDEEPVVICNNQCEADSVINDIWKFLTV